MLPDQDRASFCEHALHRPAIGCNHLHGALFDIFQVDCIIRMLDGVNILPGNPQAHLECARWSRWSFPKGGRGGNVFGTPSGKNPRASSAGITAGLPLPVSRKAQSEKPRAASSPLPAWVIS